MKNYYLQMPLWIFPTDAVSRSCIFRNFSDSASTFFIALESNCSWKFWNFERNTQLKHLKENFKEKKRNGV